MASVRPGGGAFDDRGRQVLTERAGFLPDDVVGGAGLFELVANFAEVSLGALRSSCLVVSAGDRTSSPFLGFGPRSGCRRDARGGIVAFGLLQSCAYDR